MTYSEQVKINRIQYYIERIEKLKNAKYHDYTKAINYYKEKAIEELKEL